MPCCLATTWTMLTHAARDCFPLPDPTLSPLDDDDDEQEEMEEDIKEEAEEERSPVRERQRRSLPASSWPLSGRRWWSWKPRGRQPPPLERLPTLPWWRLYHQRSGVAGKGGEEPGERGAGGEQRGRLRQHQQR
jgi:hypothetical protein